jgi:hypothetical protein
LGNKEIFKTRKIQKEGNYRMKKFVAITLVVVLMATLIPGVALADRDTKGNGLPKGKSYNFNVIGVPGQKNDNFDGGEGNRIFVLRTGTTQFYVHGGEGFEILDRDGTDGSVGSGLADPGLILPYVGTLGAGEWKCEIYVRLLGPIDSSVHFKSYVFNGTAYIYLGAMEFTLARGTKFQCKTGQLLADNYQDILWEMDQKNNFRIMQWRIFVEPIS